MSSSYLALYLGGALAAVGVHLYMRRRRERGNANAQRAAAAAGLNEPASLHPVVSASRCIGSGGCVTACPEGALGIVDGMATLINAAACIGHGACADACPVTAITLVFGTERRGVDIPKVSPQFESNVPGLFIAGELGGMGLIRKAATQGVQAIEFLRRRKSGPDELDVLIVGAGPAGIAAGLAAHEQRLRYRLIEQEDSLGGAVYHYPRAKIAMTAPVHLPLVGKVQMTEVSKEKLLEFWQGVVHRTGLQLHFRERMEKIERVSDSFVVHTSAGPHRARSVLLAIGRRGSPRKLGVPGEALPKVVYRLVDAEQYRGQHVMVVGGGDSALEAALQLAQEPGTTVQLSYRGAAFNRVKPKNRQALEATYKTGRLELLLETEIQAIYDAEVELKGPAGLTSRRNDAVIVCAGGVLPIPLLQQMGIEFETKHGQA
ncbi:NAD(P)-binding domain-containing protein [Pelomonas sp. APW6]|uniref:NAD(P)-binding domain-containing protein n=1 Tax=Roseateles subflavus TaxID=3053353 RepID=A0ABT7LFT0_9BURK|nr:NAD(P)-binding domain-containing protein [Pelomonas sp. APW6]MDL5031711.1 NAD(P)-binding domain-containing protein [Pelomonas sp. APW6]